MSELNQAAAMFFANLFFRNINMEGNEELLYLARPGLVQTGFDRMIM